MTKSEKASIPNIKVGDRVRVVLTNGAELIAVISQVTSYAFRLDLKTKGLQDVWWKEVWFSYFDPHIASVEVIESALLPEWVTKPRQRAIGQYEGWPATAIRNVKYWHITWLDEYFDRRHVSVSDTDFFALGFTPTYESQEAVSPVATD